MIWYDMAWHDMTYEWYDIMTYNICHDIWYMTYEIWCDIISLCPISLRAATPCLRTIDLPSQRMLRGNNNNSSISNNNNNNNNNDDNKNAFDLVSGITTL